MNERDQKIIAAAFGLFSRYGVSKTTMHDIAREAGVARQTLYNTYPNKSEVLRAVVQTSIAETSAALHAKWATAPTFAEKLDAFFLIGPLKWYDAIQSAPEVAELIDGINAVAASELEQSAKEMVVDLAAIISRDTHYESDATALADFIYSTAMNAKYNNHDRPSLVLRLSLLKASVLALIGEDPASA